MTILKEKNLPDTFLLEDYCVEIMNVLPFMQLRSRLYRAIPDHVNYYFVCQAVSRWLCL